MKKLLIIVCIISLALLGCRVNGIVAYNFGRVKNATNDGTITGYRAVGGIVGANDSDDIIIKNSINNGTIIGYSYVGGIVGYISGNQENNINTGSILDAVDFDE